MSLIFRAKASELALASDSDSLTWLDGSPLPMENYFNNYNLNTYDPVSVPMSFVDTGDPTYPKAFRADPNSWTDILEWACDPRSIPGNGITDSFYYEVLMAFNSDLEAGFTSGDIFFSFTNPIMENGDPFTIIAMHLRGPLSGCDLHLEMQRSGIWYWERSLAGRQAPVGPYFRLGVYVKRAYDPNGIVRVWFDGISKFDVTGEETRSVTDAYHIMPLKIKGNHDSVVLYMKEIAIWNDMPSGNWSKKFMGVSNISKAYSVSIANINKIFSVAK